MGKRTIHVCDLSGVESDDVQDFVQFSIHRDGEVKHVTVSDEMVTEEMNDNPDGLLAQIILAGD